MKLAIIILNQPEKLEDLLTGFLEIGISGATVLNSVGMGHIISHNIPIFAGLRDTFAGSSPSNKTILVMVQDDVINDLAHIVEEICGDFKEPGKGFMMTLPIDKIFGLHLK